MVRNGLYASGLQRARRAVAVAVAAALSLAAVPAWAEPAPTVLFDAPGLLLKKPKDKAPEVQAPVSVWPRLDTGTIVCRTEPDLARLAASRTGGPSAGSVDCQVVRTPIGVTIMQRAGPGRTQVRMAGDGGVAWTDAWLPERPPAGARVSSGR